MNTTALAEAKVPAAASGAKDSGTKPRCVESSGTILRQTTAHIMFLQTGREDKQRNFEGKDYIAKERVQVVR